MNKRNWKIIYSDYSGGEKKAVELVSKEMGSFILRDKGNYVIHVLSCEKEGKAVIDKNVVVIGTYEESAIIRTYIKEEEIKEDGYVVKVMDNPKLPECKLVLITAKDKTGVFYGATDYIDDYLTLATPAGAVVQWYDLFTKDLPDYYHSSAPVVRTRSVFTWGHPINDYRAYIDNMARLRLNQLIIWNDFVPVNAKDVVDYAHEYGIKVIWGFAWGWTPRCVNTSQTIIDELDEVSEKVVAQYEAEYADIPGDGIYFQSITEHSNANIGDKCVAEVVTEFVNKTAARILDKYPDLYIQFGLHATSVKEQLEYIKKVDERIEILWEDCGSYPYNSYGYNASIDTEGYEDTLKFTDAIINLREVGRTGVLYKKMTILDWSRFAHQSGPFVLGCASEDTIRHDLELVLPSWRRATSFCLRNGKKAYEMTKVIVDSGKKDITIGMAAQMAGGIWLPEALYAQLMWECDKPYEDIIEKVSNRRCLMRV